MTIIGEGCIQNFVILSEVEESSYVKVIVGMYRVVLRVKILRFTSFTQDDNNR